MKILLYSIFLPDPSDGASTSGRALTRYLRADGLNVTVCTPNLLWTRNQVIRNQEDHLFIFHSWFSYPFDLSPGLISFLIKNFKLFDVIHFREIFTLGTIIGANIARYLRIPYVISPLGNKITSWRERGAVTRGTAKYLYSRLFARKALRGARKVICASQMELQGLKPHLKSDNLLWIPNGVEVADYESPVPRDLLGAELGIAAHQKIFLFLGRLSREKALEFLLDSWALAAAKQPDGVLVLAGGDGGNPDHANHLRQKIGELNLAHRVIMPGPVKGPLKKALLQHSSCLVFPSYHESFGNVVLEALSAGTPVLASTGTPWQILEAHGLGRWLPWDRALWAQAMLETGAARAQNPWGFASHSRKWVRDNFSWERTAHRYLQVYREVGASSPGNV